MYLQVYYIFFYQFERLQLFFGKIIECFQRNHRVFDLILLSGGHFQGLFSNRVSFVNILEIFGLNHGPPFWLLLWPYLPLLNSFLLISVVFGGIHFELKIQVFIDFFLLILSLKNDFLSSLDWATNRFTKITYIFWIFPIFSWFFNIIKSMSVVVGVRGNHFHFDWWFETLLWSCKFFRWIHTNRIPLFLNFPIWT